ncbi:ABC-three component system protein [Pseudomonas sp. D47]|uniref:ABC-three component system protein n=1 Tax=Pseudomonas sp. D47 TaxID=3159447 RepID=UPI00387B2FFD
MIKRFRLEQKSHYERLVIAQRLSDMLDKFLGGRLAPIEIGAEQGGIKEWDDVVILHASGQYEHLQIKRQTTPFCTKAPDKGEYLASRSQKKKQQQTKTPSDPNLPSTPESTDKQDAVEGSVLDSAFGHLASWSASDEGQLAPDRTFSLTLLGAHLGIKNKLTVNHLDEFCGLCRQDGVDLEALAARDDGPTKSIYQWLTTWCGFTDWAHIQNTMKRVTVVCVGNEANLEKRAIESLERHFINPKQTLDLLIAYITSNTSDVSAVQCHAVVRHLRAMLRPDIETWTQYLLGQPASGNNPWSVSGTHNVEGATSIAGCSNAVVEHLWSTVSRNSRLRIYAKHSAPAGTSLTLPSAILRLALHLQQGSQSLLLDESSWRTSAGHQIGHTLGNGERDLKDLPWFENPESLVCAAQRDLTTQIAARTEAEALARAMDEVVWKQLRESVSARLGEIKDLALLNAMDMTWQSWSSELTVDCVSRQLLLEQLLYPATEGMNATHALRVGPRTIEMMDVAIVTLLLVAVAVGGDGANWRSFPNCGEVLSIALKHWSGPATDKGCVRELSEDGLMAVVGPSPASVVILSGVSASPTTLLDEGMADDAGTSTSMAAERRPQLLVTRFKAIQFLRQGTLQSVQQYFGMQWQDRQMAREAAIKANGKGV